MQSSTWLKAVLVIAFVATGSLTALILEGLYTSHATVDAEAPRQPTASITNEASMPELAPANPPWLATPENTPPLAAEQSLPSTMRAWEVKPPAPAADEPTPVVEPRDPASFRPIESDDVNGNRPERPLP